MTKISHIPFIILNWNNFSDTKECIQSLLTNEANKLQIYLLDNNSDEQEINLLKDEFGDHPQIKLTIYERNLGFTRAHNSILESLIKTGDEFVFLLNNDTVIPSESFHYYRKLSFGKKTGMVACKMINYWNHELMDSAGHKMLTSGEIIPLGHGDVIKNHNLPIKNIGACAGAALYSTEMLKDIGLFDEYFETGYEDAELGLRAYIAGYDCIYHPKLIIYHKMGQSIKKIFDYNYTLKIQTNIFYTYLKLVHWQVIAINFLPWVLRIILITIIDILFWRPKYLKVQYHALLIILFRDWKLVMKARRNSKRLRRISWHKLLIEQEFFLKRNIQNFYKFIIRGEKSYFEKY